MSSLQACQSTFTHVLRRFITCILLSAMLIIFLYKTGIVISSYALFLCVGVTSSSECHPSPLLFRAYRAQMGNGRRSWAIGYRHASVKAKFSSPFFTVFLLRCCFFFFFFFFLTGSTNCLEQIEKHFYWMTWKNLCFDSPLDFHQIFRRRVCFLVSFWHG